MYDESLCCIPETQHCKVTVLQSKFKKRKEVRDLLVEQTKQEKCTSNDLRRWLEDARTQHARETRQAPFLL